MRVYAWARWVIIHKRIKRITTERQSPYLGVAPGDACVRIGQVGGGGVLLPQIARGRLPDLEPAVCGEGCVQLPRGVEAPAHKRHGCEWPIL